MILLRQLFDIAGFVLFIIIIFCCYGIVGYCKEGNCSYVYILSLIYEGLRIYVYTITFFGQYLFYKSIHPFIYLSTYLFQIFFFLSLSTYSSIYIFFYIYMYMYIYVCTSIY